MDTVLLSRLQFALTTIYHWLFVPLTLGLGWFVAFMQTRYYQTRDETWRKMAKFWGKLFLINFAIGVVTGIVQEFQFGMNWSEYSRYVGDIFGAPLAVEALLAFFDFPAEHWDHLRTSNPIESVFATVRHRTVRTKGALSAKTAKLMVFKLVDAAAKTWRRLKGENQLPKVIAGIKFQNGIEVIKAHNAA